MQIKRKCNDLKKEKAKRKKLCEQNVKVLVFLVLG